MKVKQHSKVWKAIVKTIMGNYSCCPSEELLLLLIIIYLLSYCIENKVTPWGYKVKMKICYLETQKTIKELLLLLLILELHHGWSWYFVIGDQGRKYLQWKHLLASTNFLKTTSLNFDFLNAKKKCFHFFLWSVKSFFMINKFLCSKKEV